MDITPRQFNALIDELKKIRIHLVNLRHYCIGETDVKSGNEANNTEAAQADSDSQVILKQKDGSPHDDTATEEQNQPIDSPNPPFPIRLWQQLSGWWSNPFRERSNIPERVTVVITLIVAFIAGVQACIYRGQLHVMQGQITEMQESRRAWMWESVQLWRFQGMGPLPSKIFKEISA
jgi:hypothetical protein